MIIREIQIDGFGVFHDFSIQSFGKGINLIVGDNEAGKSTLLKFLKFTLFGYPKLKADRMNPLNGGQHQGQIRLILSSDREVILKRTGMDKIQLIDTKEGELPSEEWLPLTNQASSELFENIYAFSIDELINLESIEKSGVKDKIIRVLLTIVERYTQFTLMAECASKKASDVTAKIKELLIPGSSKN